MNKVKKNIVIVGFTQEEKNSIGCPSIENSIVHYCNSMSEAIKYQGYMIIIDNSKNGNIVSFDKKYRKSLNKYERIIIYNSSYKCNNDKWSRFEKMDRCLFNNCSFQFGEDWDRYKFNKEHEKEQKFNANKKEKLDILYKYIKNFNNIKTTKISEDLGLDIRSVQRYMKDLNSLYHNIGYDYSNNEWYFIW